MKNNMYSIEGTAEANCCGCGACVQACPKKCIKFEENERGFLVPIVDSNNCIKCGKCASVCPERNYVDTYEVQKAYAAIIDDKNIQNKSTSGGIFFALANQVLKENGVVCGAIWNSDNQVVHSVVDSIEELGKMRQSKYVQSDIRNSYNEIKQCLMNGKMALFSGTACQIAGLKTFLVKEFDGLITIEVACHGVPSPGLFKKYIKWLEKKENARLVRYYFRNRDKHSTGEHYMSCAEFNNSEKKYYSVDLDPYYSSFLKGKTIRETCYKCKYKKESRISDITLSDFWGIEKELPKFPAQNGCSAVLINSKKGQELFNKISNKLKYEQCTKDMIYRHNTSMIISCNKNIVGKLENIRIGDDKLFEMLKPKLTIKEFIKISLKHIIPSKVKYRLKRFF